MTEHPSARGMGRHGIGTLTAQSLPADGPTAEAVPSPSGQGVSVRFPPENTKPSPASATPFASRCAIREVSSRRVYARAASLSRRRVVSLPARR